MLRWAALCIRLERELRGGYSQAPSEAEAQCAELCRGGLVYGAGSEDMDTLTFGSPVLLRHLTFAESRKMPIDIINLPDVLKGLEMDMDKFIDFCILCGCDYLEPLKKIGGKTALKHINDKGSIDAVLEHLRTKKNKDGVVANPPPEDWPYEEARELFKKPDVIPSKDIDVRFRASGSDCV
jgi:flap endonuclease-1